MKATMNKRDIAKFHNYLEKGAKVKECSRLLGVTEATLKKFSPVLVQDHKEKVAAQAKLNKQKEAEQDEAAETLAKAAKKAAKK